MAFMSSASVSIQNMIAIGGLLTALCAIQPARAVDVTVFAAASLGGALGQVEKDYQRKTGQTVAVSLAASSVLARQIESAQGADIFISADTGWMDELDRRGLIQRDTRRNLLGNHLALIAPLDSRLSLRIVPQFGIAGALRGGRLALADPDSVPAGKYAKAALTALGVWDSLAAHLAPAENVRAALAYVARAETPLGVVYSTDAYAEPKVRIVDAFPDKTHPPIVYPVALMKEAKPAARALLEYVEGGDAWAVFRKYGFDTPR